MGKFNRKSKRLLDQAFDDQSVKGRNHHILLIMARRANSSGECFMAIGRIAKESGWSRKTVSIGIGELQQIGHLVEVEGKPGRATRTFRVVPGGQVDMACASNGTVSTGQIDPQNHKSNQKENPSNPVEGLGILKRRRSTASLGSIARSMTERVEVI